MSIYYIPTIKHSENSFYAAANSACGFVSYFDECFGNSRKIIIKGGPGCGKSTRIKSFAECAKSLGDTVRYYYCSSDTSSLDGVLLEKANIALIDGTSPHAIEPKCPGACDEILNLCDFWDQNILKASRSEIEYLSNQCSLHYKIVYSLLASAKSISEASEKLILPYIDLAKIQRYAKRIADGASCGTARHLQCDAIGTLGALHLDTLDSSAGKIILLRDKYGIASLFLSILAKELDKKRRGYAYSLYPPDQSICEILLDRGEIYSVFADPESASKVIDTSRFLQKNIRCEKAKLHSFKRICNSIYTEMIAALSEIGTLHGNLEKIYISAMDYAKLACVDALLCEKLRIILSELS